MDYNNEKAHETLNRTFLELGSSSSLVKESRKDLKNILLSQSSKQHRVLLVGSGMMTPALVDYLCRFKDTKITCVSNLVEDAKKVASRHPDHITPEYLDIFDVSPLS
jgi:glutamyl-tRNA reductase